MLQPTEPLKVCLVSLGCPKNLVDSEKMLADLSERGCIVAAEMDEADVVVVNTCGFLAAARDEAITVIQEALEHKQRGSVRRVVVAGCLPTRDGESLYSQAPGIDALVGVDHRDSLFRAVTSTERLTTIRSPQSAIHNPDDSGRFRLTPRHTAFLRIAEGCSRRCSYCTVGAIRGPFRSKPPDKVLSEARELVADGTLELNLIAQDTTNYGADLHPEGDGAADLASLLRELDALDGVEWIRLMYTHPQGFTDELIDALGTCERVVPYVDIPLQHICDDILGRMRRRVARGDIEALLTRLRDRVGGIVLRTTFIVGFPGETDKQFEELLGFVKDFRFDALGVFEYSQEEGTPAAKMPAQVPEKVKGERAQRIMLAQQQIAFTANEALVSSPLKVLIDGTDAKHRCVGRYYGQAPEIDSICILTNPCEAGTFVHATVTDFDGYDLIVKGSN